MGLTNHAVTVIEVAVTGAISAAATGGILFVGRRVGQLGKTVERVNRNLLAFRGHPADPENGIAEQMPVMVTLARHDEHLARQDESIERLDDGQIEILKQIKALPGVLTARLAHPSGGA